MSLLKRPWIIIALLLFMLTPAAWADDPALTPPKDQDARLHFKQGNRFYRIRKFEEAIAEYQTGAMTEPAPVFDYNLGQCYRQLGKYTDAIWHYERFLKNGQPENELQALVTDFLRQMHAELDRKASTQPPTDIAPEPGPPASPPKNKPSSPTRPAEPMSRSDPWYSDGLGWGLVAGGVLTATGATYLLASASDLRDEASINPDESRRLELRDAAHTRFMASAAFGAVGGALIAIGAVKLAIHTSEPSRAKSTSWAIGTSRGGIVVSGQF